MNYKNAILSLLILWVLLSCEKQTDWQLQHSELFPVADCIITNELRFQELYLYWSVAELNAKPAGIANAQIKLSDGVNTIAFVSDTSTPGRYVSAIPFQAVAGVNYRLFISYEEIRDTANAEMTGVSPLDSMDIVPSDSLYRFIYNDSPQPAMTEVYYNWSADASYTLKYGAGDASEVYYTLSNIDPAKEFAPDRQIIRFPKQTTIIRRKYSLSQAHQDFIRALLLETDWRGGLFDAEPGNVPTNFRHGIQGWFAACTVVSDTTLFH